MSPAECPQHTGPIPDETTRFLSLTATQTLWSAFRMNKFVYSAIALTAVSASAFATDNGWVSLDQEINNLNASLSAQNATGPKVGGFIRTRWSSTSDVVEPVSGNDVQGFSLDNVRVEISGD